MTTESALWFLGEWALRAATLTAVAGFGLGILRVRNASIRLTVWTLVVYGALLIPLATWLAPKVGVPVKRPNAFERQLTVEPPHAAFRSAALSVGPDLPGSETFHTWPPASRPTVLRRLNWSSMALGVWAFGAALGLCRLAAGFWLGRKLVCSSLEIARGLRESADVTTPVTLGLLRPVTLLPPDWREWPSWKLGVVKAHEGAHIKRLDPLHQLAASVYRALCWFYPLAWWLRARVTALAEEVSDDAALQQLPDRALYAEALLDFFGRVPCRVPREGVAMARRGAATRRIERILGWNGGPMRPLTRAGVFALGAAALPIVYLAASTTLIPAVDAPPLSVAQERPLAIRSRAVDTVVPGMVIAGAHAVTLGGKPLPKLAAQAAPAKPGLLDPVDRDRAASGPPLEFEVASVKVYPMEPNQLLVLLSGPRPLPIPLSGNRVSERAHVLDLIKQAYAVQDYQISGLPDWALSPTGTVYDIQAKAAGDAAPTLGQLRLMMQSLLADRFQLRLHREMKEIPIYALTIDKNGSKLRALGDDEEIPRGRGDPQALTQKGTFDGLFTLIRAYADRPVIDETGINGRYEAANMHWDEMRDARRTDPMSVQGMLAAAVRDQLGLRLEPRKEPTEVLVIDHVEKPSSN